MDFKKEHFNAFFKSTLDIALSEEVEGCPEKQKIEYYKVIVSKFHYFVYFALIKESIASKSFSKKALCTLNGLLQKSKTGKFEFKKGRDTFEVSLETVANLVIINPKGTLNDLDSFSNAEPIDFDQFVTFFIEKNFGIADAVFAHVLNAWCSEVLKESDVRIHLTAIREAFESADEAKVFHAENDSRGFGTYSAIGESVQKQSISTNAGWQDRIQWIIDAFSDRISRSSTADAALPPTHRSTSNGAYEAQFRIFVGPPGCGKTRAVKQVVQEISSEHFLIQIHPSYGYEDLIEGIRPLNFSDGQVRYDVLAGPLRILIYKAANEAAKMLCLVSKTEHGLRLSLPLGTRSRFDFTKVQVSDMPFDGSVALPSFPFGSDEMVLPVEFAQSDLKNLFDRIPDSEAMAVQLYFKDENWGKPSYALILDELNRGNVPQLLGELVYLLGEEGADTTLPVKLQYSQDEVTWPRSLSILATMNSADISTDRLDQAIKRRFTFSHVGPDPKVFAAPASDFASLVELNENHGAILKDFKPLQSLNDLFLFCGSEVTPQTLLTEINSKIVRDADGFGVIHPHEKLLGHSYLLKVCARVCMQMRKAPQSKDMRSAILFFEMLDIFREEIIPALASILNADEAEMNRFLSEVALLKENEFSAYNLSHIERFVERLVFKQAERVTSLAEYKDLRKQRWPNAA